MESTPFLSPFGVRHGIQVVRLGPGDMVRLYQGDMIKADVLGEYVAEISYDPAGEPRTNPRVDVDAEFFSENGWQVYRPGEFLTPVAEVATLIGVEIDGLRERVRAAGFAISGRHPEAGWPDGGIVTAELPQILEALEGRMRARALLATAAYEDSLTEWEDSGEAVEWDATASDGVQRQDRDDE